MTEQEFWIFLKQAMERGREPMLASHIDTADPELQKMGEYIMGHSYLPKDYDKIGKGVITEMGRLLMDLRVRHKTKEAVMMILAHNGSDEALDILRTYNRIPDKGLEVFSMLALQECRMWNEG